MGKKLVIQLVESGNHEVYSTSLKKVQTREQTLGRPRCLPFIRTYLKATPPDTPAITNTVPIFGLWPNFHSDTIPVPFISTGAGDYKCIT
jgi:hypothetical protein